MITSNTHTMITKSVSELHAVARSFVARKNGGGVVLLSGELGAGKTTFVQGVAIALGVQDVVTSPTFVLMKNYKTLHSRIKNLVHIDAYRLDMSSDLSSIGLEEELYCVENLVCIEWPEKLCLPTDITVTRVTFRIVRNGEHEIIIQE